MDKREITLDKVEEKARKLHGDRYSYIGLIKEEGSPVKVKAVCAQHGEFILRAARHYTEGKGCPECSKSITLEEFKSRGDYKHNKRYDYSKVEFKTLKDKVIIICPDHGEFKQKAGDHLNYYGCPRCGVLLWPLKRSVKKLLVYTLISMIIQMCSIPIVQIK